ncbi:purine-cytosine permease family protein [Microbacterium murale]|uniref:Cytosine permease n=1 Tax=Microbacterium murale TaxID=1081040 RepID=A0ABQ1RTJ7_9MICO|nr:cytosine permease [Microbacterium murale]GGD78928.1 cytosine permease [Microbacterium murale]
MTNDIGMPESQREKPPLIEWAGLAPVPLAERHGKTWHVGGLWFAAQLVPSAVFLGVLGPQLGLSYWAALAAIVLGNALGALGPSLMSTYGPLTGMATLAQARALFGRATGVIGILAAFTSVAFIALGAVFGAQALEAAFGINQFVGILLVFLLEAVISVAGYRVLHQFEKIMAFVVAGGFVVVTIAVLASLSTTPQVAVPAPTDTAGSFILLAAITFGFAFGWSHNAPDYSRYLPQNSSRVTLFIATYLGIGLACVWMQLLGLTAATLLAGANPMLAIFTLTGGGVLGAIIMITMYLGVVANAAVAQYSAGLQILGAGVRLPRPVVTAFVAVLAFLLTLYLNSGDLSETFSSVLLLSTYWVAPFVGIWMLGWLPASRYETSLRVAAVPMQRLRVGWAAVIALAAGYVLCLPFSSTAIGDAVAATGSPFAWLLGGISRSVLGGGDLAYPVGIVVGVAVYWMCMNMRQSEINLEKK